MWAWLRRLLSTKEPVQVRVWQPRLVLSEACLDGVARSLRRTIAACHEGIVYLLGHTDGETTVATTAIQPAAHTTHGSFNVSSVAMARVVRAAADHGLQVVAQVHSHPGEAYHSEGDVAGARIKYPGYVSIVLPDYGRQLPSLEGAAVYMCNPDRVFHQLGDGAIRTAPGYLQ